MTTLSETAPAKINLGLEVGSRRQDGLHEIKTVLQTIALSDSLTVEPLPSGADDRLRVEGPVEVPSGPDNLVLQAVDGLRVAGVSLPPLSISLTKNIPVGAGLGGGSSDAAALLRAAAQLVDQPPPEETLYEIAARLGSDVPFLLEGGTALARGRGERLEVLEPLTGFVLVGVPPYSVSTEWAYARLDERRRGEATESGSDAGGVTWRGFDLNNDFELVVRSEYPLHEAVVEAMQEWTPLCSLSGSGSAVYGLFESDRDLQEARQGLAEKFTECSWYASEFFQDKLLTSQGRNSYVD